MKKNILYKSIIISFMMIFSLSFFTSCEEGPNFKIEEYPDFTIESFSPMAARPGTQVTINGSNFGELKGAVTVYFNDVATIQADIVSVTDGQIIVIVPANASTGKISVKIWKNIKEFEDSFEFIPGAKITSVDKERVKAGDVVTITGENFGSNVNDVHIFIGTVETEITSVTDTKIQFTVPDTESGNILLNIGGQEVQSIFLLIGDDLLTGKLIGHTGSWGNNSATTIAAAVDGNIDTFVDAPTSSGYVGYDVGSGKQASLTSVRYVPRTSHPQRMIGGEIRGANDPTLIDAVTLYTITQQPATGVYTNVNINTNQNFRYIYYYSPNESCNIAEIEFYGNLVDATIPAGKYIFEFNDPAATGDWLAITSGSTNVIADGKLKVTFNPAQLGTSASKRRADLAYIVNGTLNGVSKAAWVQSPDYPILAMKIAFTPTGSYKPVSGNIILDIALGANVGNNKYKTDYAAKNVIYYDMSADYAANTSLATRQFKIADIVGDETGYEVDWIRTFKNTTELEAFMTYMKY